MLLDLPSGRSNLPMDALAPFDDLERRMVPDVTEGDSSLVLPPARFAPMLTIVAFDLMVSRTVAGISMPRSAVLDANHRVL